MQRKECGLEKQEFEEAKGESSRLVKGYRNTVPWGV
jgi:hypothetical protein